MTLIPSLQCPPFLRFRLCARTLSLVYLLGLGFALASGGSINAQVSESVPLSDGQHDFDFNVGTWRTNIRRVLNPFGDGKNSFEMKGTVTVRKVWGGRAQLEEIEADGPNGHWEGLTLFLYNPNSRQWGQYFINSKQAILNPPLVGSFHNGRGELFAQDTFDGRGILVKGVWSDIHPDSHHFEELYSQDGGQSWHPAFIADLAREDPKHPTSIAPAVEGTAADAQHAFDFDLGTWQTQSSRLLHPLLGSNDWSDFEGVTVDAKIWNGRAQLAEYRSSGTSGSIELLALRWFNSSTGEWSTDFATPNGGELGAPMFGTFKDGRIDFYDYEPVKGRSTLMRFSIWSVDANSAQSEQAFSVDGGQTWEVNWRNKYSRTSPHAP